LSNQVLTPEKLWDAIAERVELETGDPVAARNEADRIAGIMATNNAALLAQRNATLTYQRRETLKLLRNWFLYLAGVLILAAVIFGIIRLQQDANSRTYAGYGKGKVYKHVRATALYELRDSLNISEPTKSRYAGHPAWRATVTYPEGTKKCAYVWKTESDIAEDLNGYHLSDGRC
jgi:hypothetical protein